MILFQLLNGFELQVSWDFINLEKLATTTKELNRADAFQVATPMDLAVKWAQRHIIAQQRKMKRFASCHCKEVNCNRSNLVFVNTRNWTID